MAGTLGVSEFKINHMINFRSPIRDHHVYKKIWSPYKGKTLPTHRPLVRPDDPQEALEHNKYAIGIYKNKDEDCDE